MSHTGYPAREDQRERYVTLSPAVCSLCVLVLFFSNGTLLQTFLPPPVAESYFAWSLSSIFQEVSSVDGDEQGPFCFIWVERPCTHLWCRLKSGLTLEGEEGR